MCWVETTTVSIRAGLCPSYSTVTWLLLSGRSQATSPLLAGLGQPVEDLVGQLDRQRHQFGRVVAGVAEHQPLVAGADLLPLGGVFVHAHGDVGALPVDREHHGAGVGADAHLVVGVADVADHLADHVGIVDHGLGGDFAGHDGDARGDHRLAGHAAVGVFGEQGVEDAVGDLVGQLVGMAHADRFAGEQKLALCHGNPSCCADDIEALPAGFTRISDYRPISEESATGNTASDVFQVWIIEDRCLLGPKKTAMWAIRAIFATDGIPGRSTVGRRPPRPANPTGALLRPPGDRGAHRSPSDSPAEIVHLVRQTPRRLGSDQRPDRAIRR